MLEAHTGLGCPGSSICPWITNLGKGQVHNTHTTHTEHNTTHSHTMYKTHTPQHNVQNIYSGQSACTGCSAVVSPLALAHTAPNPPRVTHLPRMEHETQEGKQRRQEIHPLPEEPLSAASHQPAETLAGVRAGSGPPAQPSWEPGKAVVLLWQRASPSSERKDTPKKETFHFSTWKILLQYQFGGLEKSCWK